MSYPVTIENLSFNPPSDSPKRVLNGVTFSVEPGEFVSLIGRNGHGKTSIIKAIAGELDYDYVTGRVMVGEGVVKGPVYQVASGVGIVHQFVQDDLIESLSIKKNIQIRQLFSNDRKSRLEATGKNWEANTNRRLSKFIGQGKDLKVGLRTLVEKLSGGQKQILNVLTALELEHTQDECHLLLLDEHLTGLDVVIQKRVMELINELIVDKRTNKRKTTVIMVTHDLEVALNYSDTILIIKNGTIAETVTKKRKHTWRKDYLERVMGQA
jgi:putative ABC transport system ATP-binding protein